MGCPYQNERYKMHLGSILEDVLICFVPKAETMLVFQRITVILFIYIIRYKILIDIHRHSCASMRTVAASGPFNDGLHQWGILSEWPHCRFQTCMDLSSRCVAFEDYLVFGSHQRESYKFEVIIYVPTHTHPFILFSSFLILHFLQRFFRILA